MNSAVVRFHSRCLAVLLGCAIPLSAIAASPWSVRVWQSEEGLPNNSINSLTQTPDGYLWLATDAGIVRFDGVRFEEFSPTNFPGEPGLRILALCAGRGGRLWVGPNKGPVLAFSGDRADLFPPPRTAVKYFFKIVEDTTGNVWAACSYGGVARITGGVMQPWSEAAELPRGEIYSIAADHTNGVWLAKGKTVGLLRNEHFNPIASFPEAGSRVCLASAARGGIWMCSGQRLWKLAENGRLEEIGIFDRESGQPLPFDLLEDRQGAVWMATSRGLFCFNGTGFETIPAPHRSTLSLFEDREGNIWAGTRGGGLNRLRPRTLELEDTAANLPYGVVQSICEQTNGTLWAVTESGTIGRRDDGGWIEAFPEKTRRGDAAVCIASDRKGLVWIATRTNLLRVDDKTVTTISPAQGLACRSIHALLASRTGELWVGGGNSRVQWYQNGEFHTFEIPPGLGSIRAMTEDSSGNIWIGTGKGGFFCANRAGITNEAPLLPGEGGNFSIRSLLATSDGSLWIGFAGRGLGRLKNGQFARVGTEQGLQDNFISQILDDDNGWLWCGSERGIFKVRQSEFDAVANHRADHLQSVVFGREQGISQTPAVFDHYPSAIRTQDGRLWMPTRFDLAVIDPKQVFTRSDPPTTLLELVTVDGRTVHRNRHALAVVEDTGAYGIAAPENAGSLQLPPSHQRVEFRYTTLSFSAPENVCFRYRLDGLDDHWIDAGQSRQAGYSRLPAGNYRFEVKACNSDGIWNPETASFGFVVLPFFWETWWFRTFAIAGFMTAAGMSARYLSFRRLRLRLRQMEQEAALARERARIARDIHDDVGGSLTEIGMLIELALRRRGPDSQNGEDVVKLVTKTRHVGESLDAIVWAINPNNDSVSNLADYISEFAADFLGTAGLACRIHIPESLPAIPLSPEARHNIFLVVKEALNNVTRHAHAAEVHLTITCNEQALRLEISDDGRGFSAEPPGPGADGLRNMRQRLESIGGRFSIESAPGTGTRIQIELPLAARKKLC
jgi:signal transduction histidine kinase/ligand-binding sensor domain-containing protein